MTPALRLACSLLLSLLLWLPTIPTALATSEDPARIALAAYHLTAALREVVDIQRVIGASYQAPA